MLYPLSYEGRGRGFVCAGQTVVVWGRRSRLLERMHSGARFDDLAGIH